MEGEEIDVACDVGRGAMVPILPFVKKLCETVGYTEDDAEILASGLAKRKDVLASLDEVIRRNMVKARKASERRPCITVSSECGMGDQSAVEKIFPEFRFVFKNLRSSGSHVRARVLKAAEMEVLTRMIPIGHSVIDFGGNYLQHVTRNRTGYHSCCPLAEGDRDAARYIERELQIKWGIASRLKNKKKLGAFADFQTDIDCSDLLQRESVGSEWRCFKKAQDCLFPARYGMAIHSVYSVPPTDVCKAMLSHGTEMMIGTLMHTSDIFTKFEGRISVLDARFVIDPDDDTITFFFENDSSNSYIHPYSNYCKYMYDHVVEVEGVSFSYEVLQRRDGILVFRFMRLYNGNLTIPRMASVVLDIMPTVEITTYRVNYNYMPSHKDFLEPITVLCPKDTFEDSIKWILSRAPESVRRVDFHSRFRARNAYFIMNGKKILAASQASFEEVEPIITGLMTIASRKSREMGALVSLTVGAIQEKRQWFSAGLLSALTASTRLLLKSYFTLGQYSTYRDLREKMSTYASQNLKVVDFFETVDVKLFETDGWFTKREGREMYDPRPLPEVPSPMETDFDDPDVTDAELDLLEVIMGESLRMPVDEVKEDSDKSSVSFDSDGVSAGDSSSLVTSVSDVGESVRCDDSDLESDDDEKVDFGALPVIIREVKMEAKTIDFRPTFFAADVEGLTTAAEMANLSSVVKPDFTMALSSGDFEGYRHRAAYATDEYARYNDYQATVAHKEGLIYKRRLVVKGVGDKKEMQKSFHDRTIYANVLNFRDGKYHSRVVDDDRTYMVGIDVTTERLIPIMNTADGMCVSCDDVSLFVFESFEIYNGRALADSARKALDIIVKGDFKKPNYKLVEGPPGCGKTWLIVEGFKPKKYHLILGATKETVLDIRKRLIDTGALVPEEANMRVRTVDSYMMNPNYKFDRVFVDEVCMVHYGVLTSICALGSRGVSVPLVQGYGDRKQIPFINFAKSFVSCVSSFTDWTAVDWVSLSRRIPQDVAVALKSLYPRGLQTTSTMKTSMTRLRIDGIGDLPADKTLQYMCFTNTEAHHIRVAGEKLGLVDGKKHSMCNVMTVHRTQGKTFKDCNVALVRLNALFNQVYHSESHAVVAISRHSNVEFTYMTVSDEIDKVSSFIAFSKSNAAVKLYEDICVNGG